MPDFELENSITGNVCGIDEVGRGPLAGPVVSAAVYIPENIYELDFIAQLNDSKKIAPKKREKLCALIKEHCPYAISIIEPAEIDRMNILQATLASMAQAHRMLSNEHKIDFALVDGNKMPDLPCPSKTVVKGDQISNSIAAASIVAKVTRDALMAELAKEHPHYGWESNAGYGSKKHIDAIYEYGFTDYHRKSFEPVKSLSRISATN